MSPIQQECLLDLHQSIWNQKHINHTTFPLCVASKHKASSSFNPASEPQSASSNTGYVCLSLTLLFTFLSCNLVLVKICHTYSQTKDPLAKSSNVIVHKHSNSFVRDSWGPVGFEFLRYFSSTHFITPSKLGMSQYSITILTSPKGEDQILILPSGLSSISCVFWYTFDRGSKVRFTFEASGEPGENQPEINKAAYISRNFKLSSNVQQHMLFLRKFFSRTSVNKQW